MDKQVGLWIHRRGVHPITAALCGLLLVAGASAQGTGPQPKQPRIVKKKNQDKEPVTQTLPVLKDPPAAVAAETGHLTFHVSPLSDKGLLSQQTRDALKALTQANHGAAVVKLRAFVAGTGDMRRVQAIVSETFTDKKLPLPALSVVQVGALPLDGAQVEIESVSMLDQGSRKMTNPNGLVFFAGQRAVDISAAMARLDAEAKSAGVAERDMLRITCFLNSLDQVQEARAAVARTFPAAATDFTQPLRLGAEAAAVCEAIGRPAEAGAAPSRPASADPSAFVLVNAPKLVFSGTQMAFHDQEADLRLAFGRLGKALEALGASYQDVVFSNVYALTRPLEDKARAMQIEFGPREPHPLGTTLLFEGLPSLDASVAVEVVAAVRK